MTSIYEPSEHELTTLLTSLGCRSAKKQNNLASAIKSILLEFQLSADRLRDSWEAYALNLNNSGEIRSEHIDPFRSYLRVNASVKVNALGSKRSLASDAVVNTPKKPSLVSSSSTSQHPDFVSPLTVTSSSTPASIMSSSTRVSMSPANVGNYAHRSDSGKVVLEHNKMSMHCEPNEKVVKVEFSEMNVQNREYLVPCVNLAKVVASEKDRIVELGQAILDRGELFLFASIEVLF